MDDAGSDFLSESVESALSDGGAGVATVAERIVAGLAERGRADGSGIDPCWSRADNRRFGKSRQFFSGFAGRAAATRL